MIRPQLRRAPPLQSIIEVLRGALHETKSQRTRQSSITILVRQIAPQLPAINKHTEQAKFEKALFCGIILAAFVSEPLNGTSNANKYGAIDVRACQHCLGHFSESCTAGLCIWQYYLVV